MKYRTILVATAVACGLVAAAPAFAEKKKEPPAPSADLAGLLVAEFTEADSGTLASASDIGTSAPDGAEVETSVLSAEDADLAAEGLDQAPAAEGLDATSALAACYWAQVRRWGKNLLGMTLWTYYQRIEWCANASYITSKTRIRWGEVSMVGWSFKGHTGSTTGGGVGYTYFRARTSGHFCLIQYFSCVQNAYPWIDMTVRRNGTFTWSTGG